MKKIVFIILAVLLLQQGTALASPAADSLYIAGNNAYSEGRFEDALAMYEEIVKIGKESPSLYYNMGNAAFRSNRLGFAILYYEKALKLDHRYEEARKNLEYVSVYKEDQLDMVPEFFLRSWINSLFSLMSVSAWSYLALGLIVIFLAGLVIYIFSSSLVSKKTGFFASLATLIIFIIAFSAAVSLNKELKNPSRAIVIAPSVVVKSTPSLSGTDLFVLHEGSLIVLDDEVGAWREIRISDGRVGWIMTDALAII